MHCTLVGVYLVPYSHLAEWSWEHLGGAIRRRTSIGLGCQVYLRFVLQRHHHDHDRLRWHPPLHITWNDLLSSGYATGFWCLRLHHEQHNNHVWEEQLNSKLDQEEPFNHPLHQAEGTAHPPTVPSEELPRMARRLRTNLKELPPIINREPFL